MVELGELKNFIDMHFVSNFYYNNFNIINNILYLNNE
jgi:hypothetical protein